MDITVPINSSVEMRALAELGAREFYCGLPPVDFTTVVNRQDAYLQGLGKVDEVVRLAAATGSRLFFTLNMYYAPDTMKKVLDQLAAVAAAGAFGLIVADAALLRQLHRHLPEIPLAASVLGHALNAEAVQFYRDAGCRRVILGTQMSLDEMASLVAACSEQVELEALVLNSGCFYEDGFCSFEHRVFQTLPRESALKSAVHRAGMSALDRGPRAARRAFYALGPDFNPCALRSGEVIVRTSAGRSAALEAAAHSMLSMERFKHKCGLCALRRLRQSGLAAVKIVGREKTLGEKKRDFRLVAAAVESAQSAVDEPGHVLKARSLFARRNGFPCEARFCYYRL